MKKALSVIVITLLAFPAFAQDDFGGGGFGGFDGVLTGSDIDALLGGGSRGNRGNNNNNQDQIPNPEALLLQVKDLLKLKKVPLSKDQEKVLKPFLETETVTMRTELEAQFGNRGNNNNPRGNNNNNNTANMLTEIFAAVGKSNTELLTSMKADLTPDQVSLITKAEKDKKVCSVMLDLVNPQQLQNRGNEGGGRGGRGGFNNSGGNSGGNFNFPAGLEEFFPQQANNNNNNRGNTSWLQNAPDRTFCTSGSSTTAERLAPISQILTKGKKPLTADQEKKFAGMIEVALPKLQEGLRATNPQMQQLLNSINQTNNQNRNNDNQNNNNQGNNPPAVNLATLRNNIVGTIMTQLGIPNNNNNNRGGGRGGNNNNQTANAANATNAAATANNTATANNNATNTANATATEAANNAANFNRGGRGNNNNNNNNNFNPQAEIRKRNEELYDKIAAKLNPDQGTFIKKYKYDQIKNRGGAERWRGIMLEEGTPLAAEQLTQIQQLINATNQAARNYAEQLVQTEMTAVGSFDLPPNTPAQPNGSQPNPNNVPQNPAAQKVVAKLIPEVSKRHAVLERGLEETVMKLLTPPQVASYKLNKM